jgi:hypothetical protein
VSTLSTLIQYNTRNFSQRKLEEEENKGIEKEKEKVKLSLFADDMCFVRLFITMTNT